MYEDETVVVTPPERGVNPPVERRSRASAYPFAKMNVGDSFAVQVKPALIENEYGEEEIDYLETRNRLRRVRQSLSSAMLTYSKSHPGVKFSLRTVDDTTLRCWRIA